MLADLLPLSIPARRSALALALAVPVLMIAPAYAHDPCGSAADPVEIAAEDATEAGVAALEEAGGFLTALRHPSPGNALGRPVEVLAPAGHDADAALAAIAPALAAIDAALVRAEIAEHVARARGTRLAAPVTLRLLPPELGSDGAEAWTRCDGQECFIEIMAGFWQHATAPQMAFTLAHEMFHVAQMLAWPEIQDCHAMWWIEGSAEWFANLAVPGQDYSVRQGFLDGWDSGSAQLPLIDLDYEATGFFFWAGERFGASFPFSLGRFGDRPLRQVDTIRSLLSPDDWGDLAAIHLDGALAYPDGRPALPDPDPGPHIPMADNGEIVLDGPALSLQRAQAILEPGLWRLRLEDAAAGAAVMMKTQTGNWAMLSAPGHEGLIHIGCDDTGQVLLATAGAGAAGQQARITLTRQPGDCAACHVGLWQGRDRPWVRSIVALGGQPGESLTGDMDHIRSSISGPGGEIVQTTTFKLPGPHLSLRADGSFEFDDPRIHVVWMSGVDGVVTQTSDHSRQGHDGTFQIADGTGARGGTISFRPQGRHAYGRFTMVTPMPEMNIDQSFDDSHLARRRLPFSHRQQLRCTADELILIDPLAPDQVLTFIRIG